MGEDRGEGTVWRGVLGQHLELLGLQVGLTADPLAQGGDAVTRLQLELTQLVLLHDQLLPLRLLPDAHTHTQQSKQHALKCPRDGSRRWKGFLYQFADFTLQVVDAVQLPLAAALGGQPVFAAAPHVVHKLELLLREGLLLQQLLEVVSAQVHDPVDGERQVHLRQPEWGVRQRSGRGGEEKSINQSISQMKYNTIK